MKIAIADISDAFDDLIEEKRTREEISSWASMVLAENDNGNLDIIDFSDDILNNMLWRGLNYLSGVDLKYSPKSYTHSISDFMDFRLSLGI